MKLHHAMPQPFGQRNRIHAGHRDMTGVEYEAHVLRVGMRHHVIDLVLRLQLAAEMRMDAEWHTLLFQASPAQNLESFGDVLQVLLGCAFRPARAQVRLLVIASELPAESYHAEMIVDHRLPCRRILEVRTTAARPARDRRKPYPD